MGGCLLAICSPPVYFASDDVTYLPTAALGIVFPVVHWWTFCLGITRPGQRSTSTMFCRPTRRRSWVLSATYLLIFCESLCCCHEKHGKVLKRIQWLSNQSTHTTAESEDFALVHFIHHQYLFEYLFFIK